MVATMTVIKWEKWRVTLFTVCILQSPFSIQGDTWVSTIYCVRIKKLKKHMRQCELSRSLHVSVFTIESVLCLIYLQNTSFMFALHQFWPLEDRAAVLHSLLHCSSPVSASESETPFVATALRKTRDLSD